MDSKECWKPVVGYEKYYEVSNLGRVRSKNCERKIAGGILRVFYGKELTQFVAPDDYYVVRLTLDGKRKEKKVHRLVAEAFIPNPLNRPVINHKNENKRDNRVENLEWCSVRYNLRYGTTQRRRVEKISDPIRQYTTDGRYVRTYVSIQAAARCTRLPITCIYNVVAGKKESYKGFIFQKVKMS